jgi:DNA repair exonuclease SbcCD ATPase subunit
MSDKWREEQRKKQYGFGIQPTINREIQIRDDRIERLEADLRRMALDYLAADGQAAEAYQEQLAAEDRIEELENKLTKIESLMVHLVKFAEQSKAAANSGNSKRREHYRIHALSEALDQIRKIIKGEK